MRAGTNANLHPVDDQRYCALAEHDALRQTGGATGVHQHRGRVVLGLGWQGVCPGVRQQTFEVFIVWHVAAFTNQHDTAQAGQPVADAGDHRRKVCIDEQHLGCRVVHDVNDLFGRETRVERINHRCARECGVPELDVCVAGTGQHTQTVRCS